MKPGHAAGAPERQQKIRIDKWLWAARFFKTRSAAAAAVEGGKVHLNGERVKAAKTVRAGDELKIRLGAMQYIVAVRGVALRRGPATEAAKLYQETVESKQARELLAAQLRTQPKPTAVFKGRPTKKWRRQLRRFESL